MVNLREAYLQRAKLIQAQLQGANLTLAQLKGAKLIQAQLKGAKLIQAQLQGAVLSLTNFEGAAGLTEGSVGDACYRPKTGNEYLDRSHGPPINLPDDISIPPCKKAKEKNEAGKK